MTKYVYSFSEGSGEMVSLLGSKGAGLAEMANIGLPVPFGFTVTTEACRLYHEDDSGIKEDIKSEIYEQLKNLENVTDKKFGNRKNPLLVSVRSGGAVSVPGMMDTIVNLGMNDEIVEGLAEITGNRKFAYDTYRRFLQSFGRVVFNISKDKFVSIFECEKKNAGVKSEEELTEKMLINITDSYKKLITESINSDFPYDSSEQLSLAISAVFNSWNSRRAVFYRRLNNIHAENGTAVNIQAMVFGNMGYDSCTGVAFTRNPATGKKELFGEYMINAQGDDLVGSAQSCISIFDMAEKFPKCYSEFIKIAELLEKKNNDMQDIEFTVERNKLYILQSRNGKRTVQAAVRIAVEMEAEGLIDCRDALMRIESGRINELLHPRFVEKEYNDAKILAFGLASSPGAGTGKIYFNAEEAVRFAKNGCKVILARDETSPEDLAGIAVAEGILVCRGGVTSHAAVVARGIGKPCVSGCVDIDIDNELKIMTAGDEVIHQGDWVSIDGSTGKVMKGCIGTITQPLSEYFNKIVEWASKIKSLKIRANADNAAEAKRALEFGVEGIGLCRTEHMFFSEERIPEMRRLILANNEKERLLALSHLLHFQKSDFKEIFEVMEDRPVTIRLLDLTLHEFLPQTDEGIRALAEQFNQSYDSMKEKAVEIQEVNPMLGRRGCRMALSHPEITEMQVKAIIMAALEVKRTAGFDVKPEIMIPLVSSSREFEMVKTGIERTAEECFKAAGMNLDYKIGTMVETPRACLVADELAKNAEFFSFGTNDLTQLTYGISRDDAGPVLSNYFDRKIIDKDPFDFLDMDGVGKLIEMAVRSGKQIRPMMKFGICGEQAGDPATVEFSHQIGISHISCSPFRIPAAVIAAAQAAIRDGAE